MAKGDSIAQVRDRGGRRRGETAVEGGDTDEIKAKAEALAQVAMKLGQAIYEKDQQRRPRRAPKRRAGEDEAAGARRSSTPNIRGRRRQ